MMASGDETPSYLLSRYSAEDLWKMLDFELSNIEDLLSFRLQTLSEAVGQQLKINDPNKKGWKEDWPLDRDEWPAPIEWSVFNVSS